MSLSSGFVLSTLAFAIPVGNDDRPALFRFAFFPPKELAHFTILKSFVTVESSVSFADSGRSSGAEGKGGNPHSCFRGKWLSQACIIVLR